MIFLAVGRGASRLAPWRSSAAVILETPFQPCPKTILAERQNPIFTDTGVACPGVDRGEEVKIANLDSGRFVYL